MSHGEQTLDPGRSASFGRLLRGHRLRAGLSQAELAERAGLGERAIQRLEADRNRPYPATVDRLLSALELSGEERTRLLAAVPPRTRDAATTVPDRDSSPTVPHLRLVHPDADFRTSPAPDLRAFRVQRGRTIGREADAEAVRAVLLRQDVGVLTLTGPGGSGKTRLAIQVATNLAEQFEDGVAFVNLALVTDAAAVPGAIVQALNLRELGGGSAEERLQRHLQDRHLLLLLDNFEHVLPARTLVANLIATCPRLTVLVTSRAVLRIYGEREMLVPPLARPSPQQAPALEVAATYPAVELFVERAQAARSDFMLTADNVDAVVEICHQLDGLPLAIELAAARCKLLSPQAMLRRLERRLPLLTDGPLDVPARQQTLRGAIGWSYDLLEPDEQALFRQFGVFVGGWTIEAAESVIDDTSGGSSRAVPDTLLDAIGSLRDKSLLVSLPDPDGEPRFGMLETIREYAIERLEAHGEAAALRQRHADYYLALAERADPCLIAGEQLAWLSRLSAEHANLCAALAWLSAQQDADAARQMLRLAGALHWYWWLGGAVSEGRTWIRGALTRVGDDPEATPARARALYAGGGLATVQGEYTVARGLFDEASALYCEVGDRRGHGRALAYRSILVIFTGDLDGARASLLTSLQILREEGDRWGQVLAGSNLAAVMRTLGDFREADRLLTEYVAIARETGDRYLLGSALPKWAWVAHGLGAFERAEALGREALGLFRSLNDGWWTARCLHLLTSLAVERGDCLRAARLLGAAEQLLDSAGARFVPTDAAESSQLADTMRGQLGSGPFEAARAEGRAAALEQIVRYALDTAADRLPPPESTPPDR